MNGHGPIFDIPSAAAQPLTASVRPVPPSLPLPSTPQGTGRFDFRVRA